MIHLSDIPEIERLSTPEKILLDADPWDSIASDEPGAPTPQTEHFRVRLRRLGGCIRIS